MGLLVCDHTKPGVRHVSGDYSDMFTAMMREHAPAVTLDIYDVQQGDYPQDLDTCDGYLCTGSAVSAYDDEPWIRTLEAFHRVNSARSATDLRDLRQTALRGENTFAALLEAVKSSSLGQISSTLYDVGGQYRRNM